MPDAKYDAVVVGGGHHGTIIACYLQKAGLKTAIFERWHEIGGGACGEELPLPGFTQNVCAHLTRFFAHPAYSDFNLRDYGLVYTFPKHNEAWIFPDDRYVMGETVWKVEDPYTGKAAFSEEAAQHNLNEIARFSQRDADMTEEIIRKFKARWIDAFRKYRYSGPEEWGAKDPLEELCDDPKDGIDPRYQDMTVGEVTYELFESPEMRTLFMRAMQTSNGLFPDDPCGLYWIVHVLGLALSLESAAIVQGGTHSITHSLLRAFGGMGGEFFVLSEVERILSEGGVTWGIKLKDGTEIGADIVISDLSINLTFDLLGKDNVPRDQWDKVQWLLDNAYERCQLFWGNIALYEPPKYSANPDLGWVPRLYLGECDPEYYTSGAYKKERWEQGIGNQLYLLICPDSMWDKTRAPEGRWTGLIESFTCPWKHFSERDWLRMKREIVDRMIKEIHEYAPNVTNDNLLEAWIATPDDVVNRNPCMPGGGWGGLDSPPGRLGKLRPIPELSGYRMPVKNVYLCSSAAHSSHGIGRGSSYACYKTIARDFDLSYRPWEGRAF